jgi:predicted DNA-binding transcriptional regulator YafY
MRILESRRQEKMLNLAFQFNVTRKTICTDIEILMALFPIETVKGRYGCVKLKDGYAIYQSFLSDEQQETLLEIIPALNEKQSKVIVGLLYAHGSKRNMLRIEGFF